MRRFLLSIGVLLFIVLALPQKTIFAVGEFRADYDVDYTVSPTGKTSVTQHVTLTNQLTNLYAKKYSIIIDSTKIRNVIASDGKGAIVPVVNQKDGKTEIILAFNEEIVGAGKKMSFTIRFDHDDIAQKNGSIWELTIPGVAADPDLGTYLVSLEVPNTFGPNAYMTPLPAAGKRWTKEQLIGGGISAAYGEKQIFRTRLSYHLENTKSSPVYSEIALPPDTSLQRVHILSLDPKPVSITRDPDNNWIARYDLDPKQSMDIEADIAVGLWLTPREQFGKTGIDEATYLKPTKYWNTQDSRIVSLAQEYRTPRQIYEYVMKTLSYDYSIINQTPVRHGAVGALENPKGSLCMEFTDLFIAIARAAGIPARKVVGYAYTTNSRLRPLSLVSDILHAWPEYYDRDKQIWIPIDPTWANTTGGVNYFDKLDFNHITFAIRGVQDDYPYPAGSYRKSGKTTKDVDVAFGTEANLAVSDEAPSFEIQLQIPSIVFAGIETKGAVTVHNSGKASIDTVQVIIAGTPFPLNIMHAIDHLPPYGTESIPIVIHPTSYLDSGKGNVQVDVLGQHQTFPVTIRPLTLVIVPIVGGLAFISLSGIVYLIRRRT